MRCEVGPISLGEFACLAACGFLFAGCTGVSPTVEVSPSQAAPLLSPVQTQLTRSNTPSGPNHWDYVLTPSVGPNEPLPSASAVEIIASYLAGTVDGGNEVDACLLGVGRYIFLLYADGRLVIRTADGYREGQLSEDEIGELLGRIEDTGYFLVEGDGSQREGDPIYAVPDGYLPPDGLPTDRITVLERQVQVDTAMAEYLVPEIRSARDLLLAYAPASSAPLIPQSLELWIHESTGVDAPPEGAVRTPLPGVVEWPSALPPLHDLLGDEVFAGAVVEAGPELLDLFPRLPTSRIVAEGGREYVVAACPVLP